MSSQFMKAIYLSLGLIASQGLAEPKAPELTQAESHVVQLNQNMFPIYGAALETFKKQFMSEHPVILALFSGAGGRMILYRPGQAPIEAPSPDRTYQLVKSVGHTGIAIYSILIPHVKDPKANPVWQPQLKAMSESIAKALSSNKELKIDDSTRTLIRDMLTVEKKFVDSVIAKGTYSEKELREFTRGLKPWIKKIGNVAGQVQVNHWVQTLAEWQKLLGSDWEKTYAVTNSIYVTRQNNILFSILAQFMGTEAINRRLLLAETTGFTTTPDDMLGLLVRIVNDRVLSEYFFNEKMLMDTELFGSGAREALKLAMKRIGKPTVLPEYAHFNSNEWPWRTNPAYGDGPRTIDETVD
jgi:hypothetical protein